MCRACVQSASEETAIETQLGDKETKGRTGGLRQHHTAAVELGEVAGDVLTFFELEGETPKDCKITPGCAWQLSYTPTVCIISRATLCSVAQRCTMCAASMA